MPSYIVLARWTDQGVRNIRELPRRIADAEQLMARLGATMKDAYVVNGRYDVVVVAEAPDDETATKAVLAVASLGNVRTETLRAYTRAEIDQIIGGLP